ncbi:MAG: SDR family NAD(P)-dependent oxidoreductase, partial [Bacillota bacterium]|nr:SDR family NAD(P)-dependent oxidoreductase [Bacillota bacterium]
MQDLFSMAGKVVIITGGSGYLGSAITEGFLAQGAQVIVADLAHTAERLSAGIEQSGDRLRFVACDLAKTDSIRAMLQESAAIWGRIDVLVNCATYGALNPIEKMTDEEWNRGLDGAVGT